MVKCGVFFAVRTEFLNIIYTCYGFKGLNIVQFYYENSIMHMIQGIEM
jgi:hypothetical protein